MTPGSPGALDTMRDVERALALARLGTPALSRGLATVAATWPLDPDGLPARRPGLRGGLVHAYRKLVHRFLWWHHREQLQAVGAFHGLVNHSFHYLARALAESERARRADREELEARIAELEARLAGGRAGAPEADRGGEARR